MSDDKERKRKLEIAKLAYRDIMSAINRWENGDISFHWDGCISVDDELFHERELMNDQR